MNKKIIIVLIFALINTKIFSQQIDKWSDSTAKEFLQNNKFGEKIRTIKTTINGKTILSKNYYCYESFSFKMNDSSNVFVYNFGTYDTEGNIYIMVEYKSIKKNFFFILGDNEYENELDILNNFFKKLGDEFKEEYKIEITDLFLRCKRGQRETPKYIH